MTGTTAQTIEQEAGVAIAAAQALAPAFGPNAIAAVSLAGMLLNAATAAANGGTDITPDQLAAIFAADDAAKVADLAAQASVGATG